MTLTTTHIPPWLKRLGIPLGLGGLVLGLGWYLFVSGYGAEIELRRRQLEALSRETEQGEGLEQQLRDRSGRNRRLASRLESLKAALPEEGQAAVRLRQLQAAAAGSRLKVKGIRKMPGEEGEIFFRQPHGLVLAGAYHDLGAFFEKLARLAPILSVEDLRISAVGPEGSAHTLTADVTAVFHGYKSSDSPVEFPLESVSPAKPDPYRYRAGSRRDPFGVPRAPAPLPPASPAGVRPDGLRGHRVSELELVGLVEAGGEFTAMATGRRDRCYLLKKGDRLFDGRVLEIDMDGVVFSHRIEGAARKRTRRVVRKLHPAPGEESDEK